MKKAILGVALLATLALAYVIAGPYITLHQVQDAAQRGDAGALSEYIEFPSVRQSLKDQINAAFLKSMAENGDMKGNAFATLGTVLAGTVVDKMIDAYITPAAFAQMMEDLPPATGQDANDSPAPRDRPFANASRSYESPSRFVVRTTNDDGQEVKLILRRRGMTWKITEFIIPMDR